MLLSITFNTTSWNYISEQDGFGMVIWCVAWCFFFRCKLTLLNISRWNVSLFSICCCSWLVHQYDTMRLKIWLSRDNFFGCVNIRMPARNRHFQTNHWWIITTVYCCICTLVRWYSILLRFEWLSRQYIWPKAVKTICEESDVVLDCMAPVWKIHIQTDVFARYHRWMAMADGWWLIANRWWLWIIFKYMASTFCCHIQS